jgi:hypothetical protein
MKIWAKIAATSLIMAGITHTAAAQDVRTASEQVVACQVIATPMEKLACFEAAATNLSAALEVPIAVAEIAPAPAEAVNVASTEAAEEEFKRRRLLPSWVPTVSLGGGGDKDREKEPDFYETEVDRIVRNKLGRHFFSTSDGVVWRQIRIEEIRAPKSLPAKATIKQTLGGSIRIEIEGTDRSYAVYRVE